MATAAAASSGTVPNVQGEKDAPPGLLPWVEKYRPVTLNDVVGNTEAIDRLKVVAQDGNMPHMLLAGPPGTGKTSSIMCLSRELLGEEHLGAAVLELNASDERGIDVIRSRIKMFAQKKVVLPPGRHKVVILDEADSMTSAAQQALRRTMEIYSHTTRFALACNTSSKIIEPIQSRCAILRFSRLADEEILDRLRQICEAEHVGFSDDGLEAVIFTAEGDMRNAINNLQSTYSGFGYVNQANVFKVCDQPHPLLMKEVLDLCAGSGDLKAAQEKLLRVWNLGYSASDIIGTLFKVCRNHGTMNEGTKLNFIREIGMVHMRIAEGLNSRTQILGLLAKLCALQHKQQQQHGNGKGQSN
ncbi:hypothetical protein NSK_008278 [Nannochloropsis salina CCMP1776]|uniref:AAA+ ATPase domain-containing protein n=1 Tax=Nannochloropsis salina CCMP1776 TaxID=1027361 RepID=A0A4D9CMN1_9STRA|nr:hypothetical protein NSK_008278 [Nannochloropsis salina CCMP1776]|eukprot:TFJ80371.1 hypothetical protein NSK_008278 [Nannochloropsis salina CCMP1776]